MSDSYHFIGIGGIGMSGLARLLLSQKISVTGSDIALNPTVENLIKEGAVVHKGHAAENIPPQSKVVYTTDVKEDNPEYQAAVKLKLPLLHRSDLLAALLKGQKALAVAGTHGKTSTSALLATVLVEAGLDPSFAVGGVLPAFQSNARFGKGELFPFEADESDRSFLKYHPFGAIVTNIDNDHLNNYEGNFSVLIDAFRVFMHQVESSKHLFWCRDDAHLAALNIPGQSYGYNASSDWKILSHRQEGFRMVFDLEHKGCLYSQIELSLVGRHNVLNAAAVFGLALTLGIQEEKIRYAFKTFKGVLRRCEEKGNFNGIQFLDDYAHHPSEIQTTLQGIRQAVGPRRLVAVFQPHRYSRTKDCLGQYGCIFDDADELLVTDIYGAGEAPIPHLSHTLIMQEIGNQSTVPCRYVPRSALSHYLSEFVQPYDVVVTLGAGDITKLGNETLSLLEKKSLKPLKIGFVIEGSSSEDFCSNFSHASSPYMKIFPFYINKQGKWASGKESQCASAAPQAVQGKDNIPLPILDQLQACDVVIPMIICEAGSLQGFLDILGIPYVGSGPREIWLSQEIDLLRQLLVEKGIRALSSHLRLGESDPKGDYYEFLVRDAQDIPILSSWRYCSSTNGKYPTQEALAAPLLAQGKEFAKRIYRALGCKRVVLIRLLLDNQNGFWFDRILPVSGNELTAFIQNEQAASEAAGKKLEDLILYALQASRLIQRKRPNV